MRTFRSVFLASLVVVCALAPRVEAASEPRRGEGLLPFLEPFIPKFLSEAGKAAVRFPNDRLPNGNYLRSVVLTAPSVFRQVDTSNYFLLSFWFNADVVSNHATILRVEDPGGNTVIDASLGNQGDITATLQVANQSVDTTTTVTFQSTDGPLKWGDGRFRGAWHNVIISAHMTGACLTDNTLPCCLTAEYVIDGHNGSGSGNSAASMSAVDSQGNVAGTTVSSFGPFVWNNATSWTIGGILHPLNPNTGGGDLFYRGMLAEFYLQLDDNNQDPPTPLLTTRGPSGIISKFFNRDTRRAVNLNGPLGFTHTCLGPTGRTPTMCNAGTPVNFLIGLGASYVLSPQGGEILPAMSDPCDPGAGLLNVTGCK